MVSRTKPKAGIGTACRPSTLPKHDRLEEHSRRGGRRGGLEEGVGGGGLEGGRGRNLTLTKANNLRYY